MWHSSRAERRLIIALAFLLGAQCAMAGELKLALANSTCDAMRKVGELYQKSNELQITYICKSSGLLAKGLAGSALAADIYVSADHEWMEYAIEKRLVSKQNVTSPWGNALVLAMPRRSPLQIGNWQELASPKVAKILIGDPSTAPFGRYAKQALESAGLWEHVKGKIATRKNIELLADSLAEAEAGTVGILFKSNLTEKLRESLAVNKPWHQPIRYYMAPLDAASADGEEIKTFLKFVQGRAARDIFQAERFDVSPQ